MTFTMRGSSRPPVTRPQPFRSVFPSLYEGDKKTSPIQFVDRLTSGDR